MDLGSKIRKYRTMHDMTQNELGTKIGFSSATADSRIRKYESNKMAPKGEIRSRLVEALDVDESALTDIDIQTFEDMMRVFFQLEEELGMNIEITQGKTSLTFDHANKDTDLLRSYLFSWYSKKRNLPDPEDQNYEDALLQYELWKARFPRDIEAFWKEQEQLVSEAYTPIVAEIGPSRRPPEKISDLIRQFRKMIEAGIRFRPGQRSFGVGDGALLLSFLVSDLLETKETDSGKMFAEFLCDLNAMEKNGIEIRHEMLTTEIGTQITYILRLSQLTTLVAVIERIQQYEDNKDKNTEWDEKMFRFQYEEDLRLYNTGFSV